MVACVLSRVEDVVLLFTLPPPSTPSHPSHSLPVVRNGTMEFPRSRVLTAWGEWLWVSTVISLRKDSSGQANLSSANVRMSILG